METTMERPDLTGGEPAIDPRRVAARTVGLALDCRRFGDTRQGDLSKVTVDADKTLLGLSKRLVPRRRLATATLPAAATAAATALRRVERVDDGAQDYLKRTGLPSLFKPGIHRIPLALMEEVEAELARSQDERIPLVAAFVRLYPGLVDAMAGPLGSQYRRADYPPADVVEASFGFEWKWIELDAVPDKVRSVSRATFLASRKRLDAQMQEVAEGVRLALREYFREIVSTVGGKLAGRGDGVSKKFRQSSILADLTEFLRTYPMRDVTDDAALAALVEQAQRLTAGLDLEAVKADADLQGELKASLAEIETGVGALLVRRGQREIELADDGEVL